jgi:hypothetical protein
LRNVTADDVHVASGTRLRNPRRCRRSLRLSESHRSPRLNLSASEYEFKMMLNAVS